MKLVLIYGPPATGKLTIAKKLVEKIGFKLFHNHAAIDFCFSILDPKSKRSWTFIKKMRLDMIREAVKQNISGIIMTIAYTGEKDYIRKMIEIVEKKGGKVYFVRLECDFETLKKRVTNQSRKQHGKSSSIKTLKEWFEKFNDNRIINERKNLVLNTSKLSPSESVNKILKYIK